MDRKHTTANVTSIATAPHYSDQELESEFKPLILKRLGKAKIDLEFCKTVSINLNSTTSTGRSFDIIENAGEIAEREKNKNLADRQSKYIENLEAALFRIGNKTYGICRCGKCSGLIDKRRLMSNPITKICIEGKLAENAGNQITHLQKNSHRVSILED